MAWWGVHRLVNKDITQHNTHPNHTVSSVTREWPQFIVAFDFFEVSEMKLIFHLKCGHSTLLVEWLCRPPRYRGVHMGVSNRSDILTSPIGKSRIKSEEDEKVGRSKSAVYYRVSPWCRWCQGCAFHCDCNFDSLSINFVGLPFNHLDPVSTVEYVHRFMV